MLHDEPIPPTKYKPQLTLALETVCLKAMAKDPAKRYQTALLLANDVQALLQGTSLRAQLPGFWTLLGRRVRERLTPRLIGVLAGVIVVAIAGGLFWRDGQLRATNDQQAASAERRVQTKLAREESSCKHEQLPHQSYQQDAASPG